MRVVLILYSLGKLSEGHQDQVTVFSVFVSLVLFYVSYVVLGELVLEE